MNKVTNQKAFTLVELAIVIVIIGLLVGGVLTGQELIKQAQVRNTIKQMGDYVSATTIFRDKFKGVPGDIVNGDVLFGTNCATPVTDCNGNGNGKIDTNNEAWKFWKQLSLANLIKGSFTGVIGSDSWTFKCGENCPNSAYKNGVITNGLGSSTHYKQNTDGNILEMGLRRTGDGTGRIGLVEPADAYQIDQKMDDGNAAGGRVLTVRGTDYTNDTTKCVDKDFTQAPPVNFLLTDTNGSCRMQFKLFD